MAHRLRMNGALFFIMPIKQIADGVHDKYAVFQ